MTDLHLPWLELAFLVPLLGAAIASRCREVATGRRVALVFAALTVVCAGGEWIDFVTLDWNATPQHALHDVDGNLHWSRYLVGRELLVIDRVSAPLLPLASWLYFLTILATERTKAPRFSFAGTLLSLAVTMATFSCKEPWALAVLLSLGTLQPILELRARNQPIGVYALHMGCAALLLLVGCCALHYEGVDLLPFAEAPGAALKNPSLLAILPILLAVLIRGGVAPLHCWATDLFERGALGTAILSVAPMTGAYAAVRLVLPFAADEVVRVMGGVALFTALYAAGMALVQTEPRRFFCYLFLSHSALILAGLEMVTAIGLTGALCLWTSSALSLTAFGLTLRAIESRVGRLSLTQYQGLYDAMPTLAGCYLLSGLASVGFPGTLGFVGAEMLVDGAVSTNPLFGIAIVAAAALNGIAVVHTYMLLFTGKRRMSTIAIRISDRERFAIVSLAALIVLGGTAPQLHVGPRHHAAEEILELRRQHHLDTSRRTPPQTPPASAPDILAAGKARRP